VKNKTFIGLTGVKESGKTTAFETIKNKFPNAEEVMLAKKLKDTCSEVLGIPRNFFEDQRFKEQFLEAPVYLDSDLVQEIYNSYKLNADFETHVKPHIGRLLHTPREAAQYIGTEVLRSVDPDVHCNAAVQFVPESELYVVTDMRFWNEFDFFNSNEDLNFSSVYIKNSTAEAKLGPNSHVSEKFVLEIGKKCDFKILNDGVNLESFQEKILDIASSIIPK